MGCLVKLIGKLMDSVDNIRMQSNSWFQNLNLVQVNLVILGFNIREFAYLRSTKMYQNSVFADFVFVYLAYMRFFLQLSAINKVYNFYLYKKLIFNVNYFGLFY